MAGERILTHQDVVRQNAERFDRGAKAPMNSTTRRARARHLLGALHSVLPPAPVVGTDWVCAETNTRCTVLAIAADDERDDFRPMVVFREAGGAILAVSLQRWHERVQMPHGLVRRFTLVDGRPR